VKQTIKKLFSHSESDTFKTKVKRGTVWTLGLTVWTRGIGIITSVVVTRLLNPDDFGLMAIATAIVAIMTGVTATGFNTAIIQKQNRPELLLDSAWTMELIKGLVLFGLIYFTAPLVSNYYSDPALTLMLRVLGLTFFLKGIENIGVIWFRKNLDIRKEFVLNAVPDMFYFIVVIALAFYLRSVWALVLATVLSVAIKTVFSYIIHDYRPRIKVNLSHFQDLFSFGKWILGGSIVVMARTHGVSLFIAKYFNVGILGVYNRGTVFSQKIFNELTQTLWKIGFPAFSQLSINLTKFKEVFLIALRLITTIGFPMAIGLYVLTPEIVNYLLTEKWNSIIPVVQLFSLSAIPGFIQTPVGISYQSLAKPDINTKLAIINLTLFVILIYPVSVRFGIEGIILTSLFCNLLILPIGWIKMNKILGIRTIEFINSFIPQLIIAAVMGLTLMIFKINVYEIRSLAVLLIYILFGALLYTSMVWASDKLSKTGFKKTLDIIMK
jgi:O-antigen/teichoic acid export membrane protein